MSAFQQDEHALELGRALLLELNDAMTEMRAPFVRRILRDVTILADGAICGTLTDQVAVPLRAGAPCRLAQRMAAGVVERFRERWWPV